MTEQIKFRSQADIQRWLLEKPGRRVKRNGLHVLPVGYSEEGALCLFQDGVAVALYQGAFDGVDEWQPVPAPRSMVRAPGGGDGVVRNSR